MKTLIAGITMHDTDVEDAYLHNEAFDQTFCGIAFSDLNGNIQFVNTTFALLHGYNEKELCGKHLSLFHTHEQIHRELIPLLEMARVYGHCQGTVGHVNKDGTTFSTRMSLNVLKDDDSPIGFIFITKNNGGNSPKPEIPKHLIKKTHHLETSARKIAHDFNNFLNVIIGNIEISIRSVPKKSQLRSNLEEVLLASARAQDLVREILDSTRPDNHTLKPLHMPVVVMDTLRLLLASLPIPIEFSQKLSKGNGWVLADPTQIQRIIMNLCINGYHAMEQTGGKLNVTITEIDIDPADSANLNMDPGAYVCMSVSDTGSGIELDVIDRIFEPYFSTKEKGNGLGLYIVLEIVKSYGGNIRVCSEPGKGTAFDVYLPRIDYDDQGLEAILQEQTT